MSQEKTELAWGDEGRPSKRPLQFFWLTDYSGSMTGTKIASLNQAISEAIPAIKAAVQSHPEVEVFMRAIKFANKADWHVGPDAVPLEQFTWPILASNGQTATASAIELLATELDIERMGRRNYPPVCILISDGYCTDSAKNYEKAIATLNSSPWGKKAVRLAIAVGKESEYDEEELLKFVNHPEVGVLKAHNPDELLQYIKWASTAASIASSMSKSKGSGAQDEGNVVLPIPQVKPPEDVGVNEAF